ncbi:MAG: hypothetical protein AAF628_28740 [Planctomycetota bacterium]
MRQVLAALLSAAGLATALSAQLPPGHVLTLHRPGAGSTTTLGRFEPLGAGFQSFALPAGWSGILHRAVPTGSPDRVLVGAATAAGSTEILLAALGGDAVTGFTSRVTGLQGRVVGMAPLPSADLLIATTHSIYVANLGAGVAADLLSPTQPLGCRDLAVGRTSAVVLAAAPATAAAVLFEINLATRQVTPHALGIRDPTAVVFSPGAASWMVGDSAGVLYLVDALRFTQAIWLSTGLPAITALAWNSDQQEHVLASGGALSRLSGRVLYPAAALGVAGVHDLGYEAYTSSFRAFGNGCPGTGGQTPRIGAVGRPFPGNSAFGLSLDAAAPSTQALLLLGGGGPQIGLGPIGAPSCTLYTVPSLTTLGQVAPVGRAFSPLPIPAVAALAGASIVAQWFVIDAAAPGGLAASDAGRATL